MSMADITAAAQAMNNLRDAYNAKASQIDAALAIARHDFDTLSNDLKATVAQQMSFDITFRPNEPVADLNHNGHFRTWEELLAIVQILPDLTTVTINIPGGELLQADYYRANLFGARNFRFIGPDGGQPGTRPRIKIGAWDKINANSWYGFNQGQNGTLYVENIDIVFDTNINAGVPVSPNNAWTGFSSEQSSITLINCLVSGLPNNNLVRSNGGIVLVTLRNAVFSGIGYVVERYDGQGVAIISARDVTFQNGAQLYNSSFILGQNIFVG